MRTPKYTQAETDAVKATLYSAYSLILQQLLDTSGGDDDADTWLRLTARGMRMDVDSLAHQLYHLNLLRIAKLTEQD